MRRAARPLLYAGVLVVVFGLAAIHARFIGHYTFAGTSRFALDDGLRRDPLHHSPTASASRTSPGRAGRRSGRRWARPSSGALAISVIQLFVGDALLPRFVVFGSALLLPDWYRVCVGLGRRRAVTVPRPATA